MNLISKEANNVVIEVSKNELLLINNAINEITAGPDAIDEAEFHTRIGLDKSEANKVLEDLRSIF